MIIDAINGGGGGGGGTVIVPKPTVTIGTYTYDGTEQGATIEFTPSTASKYCVITNATATNAGTYTLTIALKNTAKMVWGDMTTADLTYSYTIGKAPLTIPTLSTDSFTYDGSEKSLTFSDFDGDLMIKSGDLSGTNVGNYSATISLIDGDNYKWSDNTSNPRVYNWSINKVILTVPTVSATTKTYSGSAQSPTITGFDSTTMTKTGDSATNAGSYTVSFDLIDSDNYQWNSSTTSFAWTINKATVTLPAVTNTSKTYNGSVQSPTIASYDTTKLTVSGNSATNAGNYTVVFSLVDSDNYQMSGTNNVAWSIARATSAITLSASLVTLDSDHLTRSVTVSNVKGRTLSVSSSNTSVATASISGSTVTISNVNQTNGNATITISAAQSTNYNASSKTVSVSAEFSTWLDDWLTAGGLTPSSYADLDAVLADEVALRRLFTIHASVNSLVTNISHIDSADLTKIFSNNYVAKWINLRDYALDTLYANSTIKTYMDTADKYFYGEWVITDSTTTPPTWGAKGNVPVMTSDTAPYGQCYSSSLASSSYHAYYVTTTDEWLSASTDNSPKAYYRFTNPIKVKKVTLFTRKGTGTGTQPNVTYSIIASNDGTNWTTLSSGHTPNRTSTTKRKDVIDISNDDFYLYYGIVYSGSVNFGSSNGIYTSSLQFYGREMKVSVPTMTSNTAPYGEAFASKLYSTYYPWNAFDGNKSASSGAYDYYNNGSNVYPVSIGYDFKRDVLIKYVVGYNRGDSSKTYAPKTFKVQGYSNNEWTDLTDVITNANSEQGGIFVSRAINANDVICEKFRLYITGGFENVEIRVQELQFYGFDYSEYDWDTEHPRHYIYDHGVEPNGTISGGTKGKHALTLSAVGTATLTINTTSYTAMGGKAGMRASGTNALKCGSATSNFAATNMPYGNGIDITSVNGSNAVGIAQTSVGTFDAEEVWIA